MSILKSFVQKVVILIEWFLIFTPISALSENENNTESHLPIHIQRCIEVQEQTDYNFNRWRN